MFLKASDFYNLISQDHLSQVTSQDPAKLESSMAEAESEIKSYLRGKFDLDKIFQEFNDFNPATTYTATAEAPVIVWHGDKLYQTTQDVLAGASTPPAAPWTLTDPREPRIKQVYKDVTLYHLHSVISPRNIPDLRVVRYRDAIAWLKAVQSGEVSTDLPKVTTPNFTPEIYSQPRQSWMY